MRSKRDSADIVRLDGSVRDGCAAIPRPAHEEVRRDADLARLGLPAHEARS
jgi:hypothetical protein